MGTVPRCRFANHFLQEEVSMKRIMVGGSLLNGGRLLIICMTDKPSMTLKEIKHLIEHDGGKVVSLEEVLPFFVQKVLIEMLNPKRSQDEMIRIVTDAGALPGMKPNQNVSEAYCDINERKAVMAKISRSFKVRANETIWIPVIETMIFLKGDAYDRQAELTKRLKRCYGIIDIHSNVVYDGIRKVEEED